MGLLIIRNTVNNLKYICDETISETLYDEESSTIIMCKKDWEKFKDKICTLSDDEFTS